MVCAFGAGEQHHNDGLFCARLLNCTALAQIELSAYKILSLKRYLPDG